MTNELQVFHLPGEIFFWPYDIGCRIKPVSGAGESGNEPRQSRALLAVLVLDETPDLSVVGLSILLINHRDHVANLVIHTLVEDGLCSDYGGDRLGSLDGLRKAKAKTSVRSQHCAQAFSSRTRGSVA